MPSVISLTQYLDPSLPPYPGTSTSTTVTTQARIGAGTRGTLRLPASSSGCGLRVGRVTRKDCPVNPGSTRDVSTTTSASCTGVTVTGMDRRTRRLLIMTCTGYPGYWVHTETVTNGPRPATQAGT
eukprot:1933552-Rhodomonas_salina.1